jgi:hypothetical protein
VVGVIVNSFGCQNPKEEVLACFIKSHPRNKTGGGKI